MIKIEKGRLTRYARKVDVFFSVTAVTRVTQTMNAGKNRQENASSPTHSTEKKKEPLP